VVGNSFRNSQQGSAFISSDSTSVTLKGNKSDQKFDT
jgi:hypothetical protein